MRYKWIKDALEVFGLFIAISALWIFAERSFYGEVTPRGIDTFIAVILSLSLYFNFKRK